MSDSGLELICADVHGPLARGCLERYFGELESRFPEGFDRATDDASALGEYAPPGGVFLVARLAGTAVGCGALRPFSPGVGEVKRMWVSPEARGRGVARKLLAALESAARERRLRAIRLDTHSALAEALRLYRAAGYREIPRFNDNPYAHHWFEKTLD